MKKVTFIIRSPFIDKIPSLKNLILFLGQNGVLVKVIMPVDSDYPVFSTNDKNIIIRTVKVRRNKFELPTSVKLFTLLMRDIIFDSSDIYISCDDTTNELIVKANHLINIRRWAFLLEYPDVKNKRDVENIVKSEKIITHDKWHSAFLNAHCGTCDEQFLYLPNSTFTQEFNHKSNYLNNELGIDLNKKIILHSGGLGKWFLCKEFAKSSHLLDDSYEVVFHTSHNTTGTLYYREMSEMVLENGLNVTFSLNPVSDEELDYLVGSAFIGCAFYSVKELGYRAENMGLAAGKIGNYLKCGVPVIATNLPSLKYLEEYKCGVLIDSFSELPTAVEIIKNNYSSYEANAFKCYRELWDCSSYLNIILQTIMKDENGEF